MTRIIFEGGLWYKFDGAVLKVIEDEKVVYEKELTFGDLKVGEKVRVSKDTAEFVKLGTGADINTTPYYDGIAYNVLNMWAIGFGNKQRVYRS